MAKTAPPAPTRALIIMYRRKKASGSILHCKLGLHITDHDILIIISNLFLLK